MDFVRLNEILASNVKEILINWLPGGKFVGTSYHTSSLQGGPGDSLKININNGVGKDFSGTQKGWGDFISLYGEIHGFRNIEAANELAERYAPQLLNDIRSTQPDRHKSAAGRKKVGEWIYKDKNSEPIFAVEKYTHKDGKKSFLQKTYDQKIKKWEYGGLRPPRPLYGLDGLEGNEKILLVEGEACVDAARNIVGDRYHVMTWSGGANSFLKTDFTPIHGKKILLWPDADPPGIEAMEGIAEVISEDCLEVKIIYPIDLPKGWDSGNAIKEKWDWTKFYNWAKDIIVKFELPKKEISKVNVVDLVPLKKSNQYSMWGLEVNGRGIPIDNVFNIVQLMDRMEIYTDNVWWDEFHRTILTDYQKEGVREWQEFDTLRLMYVLQRDCHLPKVSSGHVHEGVQLYSRKIVKNEPKDWIKGLEWDKHERISSFFPMYFGVEHNEYSLVISKNFWISIMARVFQPGCKVDNMVVLEGKEGQKKSWALGVIGGKWFTSTHESVASKDFYMILQSKLLIEIEELDSFTQTYKERETIKAAITRQIDRFRPPYGRIVQNFPRQCVFVGTTNKSEYLHENTGLRRFWPLIVKNINLEELIKDRDQLFAEAYHMYVNKIPWWEIPAGATDEQLARQEMDDWSDPISRWIQGQCSESFSIFEIAVNALDIEKSKLGIREQRRIGKILRQMGFERIISRNKSIIIRKWKRPDHLHYQGQQSLDAYEELSSDLGEGIPM